MSGASGRNVYEDGYPNYPKAPPAPPQGLESGYQALFAVIQNTPHLDRQLNFYGAVGFIVDPGAELADGEQLPNEWFSARGVQRQDLDRSVAVRLPADPYMHVWFHSWHNLDTNAQWPPKFNQIGSRGFTLLCDDVERELKRIKHQFPGTPVLQKPIRINRKWGPTISALIRDPEDNFVEILSIDGDAFDEKKVVPPGSNDKGFLHFQLNAGHKFEQLGTFYRGFEMYHDHGVDYRPRVGFPQGYQHFLDQMKDAFNFEPPKDDLKRVDFLRNDRDCSHMHLEILETIPEKNKDPGLDPTWSQKGIVRYCIKSPDYSESVRTIKLWQKIASTKIYVEDQRGCLNWGDSQWIFYGDIDGNILTA
ncbi:hypothetical protein HBH70_026520 [Parastagonospora nodorum]|nr:hypothetical protein HBH46_194640 [Parastagonospora nodorum]KAH4111637.1 hypothetical protein HBH47_239530 [Parastagonospora nodorum]KAH5148441.1 hypothetical protein HBH70_026520 [Parastagonospora nodorum]KAH5168135.1 hypothetical protein HBH77_239830 [Parastagonospora nodorum]KAH5210347.1 hypothetical protein HBH68_075740 [Parastagonospora nodorum]